MLLLWKNWACQEELFQVVKCIESLVVEGLAAKKLSLGSFLMSGDAVRKADDVSLLGLKGYVGKK